MDHGLTAAVVAAGVPQLVTDCRSGGALRQSQVPYYVGEPVDECRTLPGPKLSDAD